MKKVAITIILMFLIILTSCSANPKTISDMAYDKGSFLDINKEFLYNQQLYTVYLKENSNYVPYLVLCNTEDNKTLLLRNNPLPMSLANNSIENSIYDEDSSYYENSYIDNYLTNQFVHAISSLYSYIIPSDINIISKDSLGVFSNTPITIKRYAYLLSYSEVFGNNSVLQNNAEEEQLLYFKDAFQSSSDGVEVSEKDWWLRTSYTANNSSVYYVSDKNEAEIGNILEEKGIRPAFYLPSDMPIKEEFIYDDYFYVLDIPD